MNVKKKYRSKLSKAAQEVWDDFADKISDLDADLMVFVAFCTEMGKYLEATEVLNDKGMIQEAPSGYVQQRPEVSIADKALQKATYLMPRLALMAAKERDRSKTTAEKNEAKKKGNTVPFRKVN